MIFESHELRECWIIPRKCASTSIVRFLPELTRIESIDATKYPTVLVARHPWDRIVSAMYSGLRTFEPFSERLHARLKEDPLNIHIRPVTSWCAEPDRIVLFENLSRELPGMETTNKGKYRAASWRDVSFNWASIFPLYEQDFALCQHWQS